MKTGRLFLVLFTLSLLWSLQARSQDVAPWEYYHDPNAPIMDFATASSTITISDVFTINDMQVMVDIKHPSAGDLMITLSGPSGTYVLSQYNGGIYDNYENTIFENKVTPATGLPGVGIDDVTNQTAYFRGIYLPQTGTTLPSSGSAIGTWTLQVYDNAAGDVGTLVKWGLIFNNYGKYKDVRWGWDLNALGMGRMPAPFVDDITAFSPNGLMPYRVLGYRPMDNKCLIAFSLQNSKTMSMTKLTLQDTQPSGNLLPTFYNEYTIPIVQYPIPYAAIMANQVGTWSMTANVYQRSDLFMSRNDNSITAKFEVTAASLGYDNGLAMGSNNTPLNNCEANVFHTQADQILTSVDVYQESNVELEPPLSPARVSVHVWDATTGVPGASLYTTGLRELPVQGKKWVTYDFNPPVSLPAGRYAFGICTDVAPTVGGVGLGKTEEGSPFDIDGNLSRLYNLLVEWWTPNMGGIWNAEFLRIQSGKMIRPNFVLGSDVGVVSIDYPPATLPNSFAPQVTFGAFAHHPNLPNLITFGKVYVIDKASGDVVKYSEKRVFLQNSPFRYTATFDNMTGLAAGTYIIKAVAVRADDENLINNEYSREYTKPFAPIITISHDMNLTSVLREKLTSNFNNQGFDVEFINRSISGSALPENGSVVWVGTMTKNEAEAARSFAETGNYFAVFPTKTNGKDIQSDLYATFANLKELATVSNSISMAKATQQPSLDILPSMQNIGNTLGAFMVAKNDADKAEGSMSFTNSFNDLKERIARADALPKLDNSTRSFDVSRSEEIAVEGERFGDISVARLVVAKSSAPRRLVADITNPNDFELTQNYPNPFNPSTNVAYNVIKDASISIRVYDILGREVAILAQSNHTTGRYIVTWNGMNDAGEAMSSGIYLYRMEVNPLDGSAPFVAAKKMVLAR